MKSVTMNLLRDERHSRLMLRFRCGALDGKRRIGMIGQPRIVKGTATNISQVTIQALRQFCTKNHGAFDVQEAGHFDQYLFEHIRKILRAITVDSAGNEVAAAENMMSTESVVAVSKEDGVEAFAPNLILIVRDKAHASRRILSRPWHCDDYLQTVASSLMTDPSSITQLIQHSSDLRAMYAAATRESHTGYVSTRFGNLRGAKHRFESMTTPLSRIVLDWGAAIAFLVHVWLERSNSDRAGKYANSCLAALDEELMIQAALLADAADESLCLIRFFDQREVDNCKVASEVQRFCDNIAKLFYDEHARTVEGHTKATLDFLQSTTTFVINGETRSIGGPRAVTPALRMRVMKRTRIALILGARLIFGRSPSPLGTGPPPPPGITSLQIEDT